MHSALKIPELLELIFAHISDKSSLDASSRQTDASSRKTHASSRQTLCALARTCTAFLEPALALLRARIVTLEPFILLLPEGKRRKDEETWITTVDVLTEDDVARMRLYAPFVRDLDLRNSNSSFEIDGASVARVAHALCARNVPALSAHQDCIFPSLRALSLVAGYADALPFLLAPSVTELDLILHYRSMELGEMRRTMSVLLDHFPPSVKKLHVVLDYPENQNYLFRELLARRRDRIPSRSGDGISSRSGNSTSPRLSDATLPHLSDTLQSLVIDFSHLDTAALHAIAVLPNLEHLEVYGGYRGCDFGVEGGSGSHSSSSSPDEWSSPSPDESSSPSPDDGAESRRVPRAESPSFAPGEGWETSPARSEPSAPGLASFSPDLASSSSKLASSSPDLALSSCASTSPSPPATRLKSLSIDILTECVLAPYIGGTVLRILNPRALTHLTMERLLSAEHVRRVCADIKSSPAAQTLTHLTLSGNWSGTTIAPRDLRALHACRGLVDLELVWIAVRFGVDADSVRVDAESGRIEEEGIWEMGESGRVEEEDIWEMVEAWPRLRRFAVRELEVGDANEPQAGDTNERYAGNTNEPQAGDTNEPQAGDAHPPACSLGGLAAFARYFPNLEELEISVDTSAVPGDTGAVPSNTGAVPVDTSAVPVYPNTFDISPLRSLNFDTSLSSHTSPSRLRSLNVGSSQVHAEPAYLAAFLARCFPHLAPEGLVSVGKRWDKVRRLLHEARWN